MSWLKVYPDNGAAPEIDTRDTAQIANILRGVGVRFEQWEASIELPADAGQDQVIAAYKADIESLQVEKGYKAVDVIRLKADHPQKSELRQKFLNEHRQLTRRYFLAGGTVGMTAASAGLSSLARRAFRCRQRFSPHMPTRLRRIWALAGLSARASVGGRLVV